MTQNALNSGIHHRKDVEGSCPQRKAITAAGILTILVSVLLATVESPLDSKAAKVTDKRPDKHHCLFTLRLRYSNRRLGGHTGETSAKKTYEHASLYGKTAFLAWITRPDISFTAFTRARFMAQPSENDSSREMSAINQDPAPAGTTDTNANIPSELGSRVPSLRTGFEAADHGP
ncbi:hypothetical protein GGR50DRAFT_694135 [Xylaria sp. CBS 124048]|nr:hypothetical protein GGR50DRAFT_694135 [Xylaria sp. CBS 124048]